MDIQATIPETVLLLALDDASGKPVLDSTTLLQALGGAGLAELVVRGRLRLAEEGETHGTKPGRFITSAAVVEPALEAFVEHAEGRKPDDALTRVVGWGGSSSVAARLKDELLGDLVADGQLAHQETKWLGITWFERYERGARTEREDAIQARARALLQGEEPVAADEHLVGALSILHGTKALPKVFPDLDAKALQARGDELTLGSWSSTTVRKAMEAMEMAMFTATGVVLFTSSN